MDTLIAVLITRLAAWRVGSSFFRVVYDAVSRFDNCVDLDGDGKKEKVIEELVGLGIKFGQRQANLAIELATDLLRLKK